MNDVVTINISNCNNISNCDFLIANNKLNIKYAINGTGKSTIAKAIKLSSSNLELTELMPFSLISKKQKTLSQLLQTILLAMLLSSTKTT